MAYSAATRAPRSPFYLYLSCFFLVVALVGFSTTFFALLAKGAPAFASP